MLGKTFTKRALAALSGLPRTSSSRCSRRSSRKEVLGVQADPRSPEHGQYGFLQDLVRHVAYETLSKRERRARHLAAAAAPRGCVPARRTRSSRCSPRTTSPRTKPPRTRTTRPRSSAKARETLVRAGERAASLGAAAEARRYFEQAAELTEDGARRPSCCRRPVTWPGGPGMPEPMASAARGGARDVRAGRATRTAPRGRRCALARFQASRGGRDEAIARLEHAFDVLSAEEPSEDIAVCRGGSPGATGSAVISSCAFARAELALDIAEAGRFPGHSRIALRAKAALPTAAATRGGARR